MRNVEFPELEHAKAQAEEERESAFAVSKNRSQRQRGPHCVVCAASRCRAVINRLEVDGDHRKRLGEKGWARRSVVVRAVGPSGAA
jgi:hypothetical protein